MNDKQASYPDWFLWLWERGFVVGPLVGLVALLVVLYAANQVDHRLDGIEERLAHDPPGRYEPPDLDEYAAEDVPLDSVVRRQSVYVPVYSHLYYRGGRPYSLEATLSIRNTDRAHSIFVRSIAYYDTKGQLLNKQVDRLIRLGPLETIAFVVQARDTTGGSGANFIVDWLAVEIVDEPVIEAVMVGSAGTQAISFRAPGKNLAAGDASE